jgi:hypothetical protein
MQHAHEHDPDRLAEVEQVAYLRVTEYLFPVRADPPGA